MIEILYYKLYSYRYEFESRPGQVYSIQHYVIKFVSVSVSDRSVVFSEYSGFLHQ